MPDLFDPAALDARYAFIDAIPPALLPAVLTHASGSLDQRGAGLIAWRDTLLAGRVPHADTIRWPAPALAAPLCEVITALGIAGFCRGEPAVVDALLADLLRYLDEADTAFAHATASRLATLEAEARRAIQAAIDARQARPRPGKAQRARFGQGTIEDGRLPVQGELDPASNVIVLREATRTTLAHEARRQAEATELAWFDARLRPTWLPRVEIWSRLAEVFGELGDHLGLGWNLAHGVLRHHGWLEMSRLHDLVSRLEPLRELVRTLGRMQEQANAEHTLETVFVKLRRTEDELRQIETPRAPTETRGIERSDRIDSMLPSEAALLTHPILRKLWHARRAERALLAYHRMGTELERITVKTESTVAETRQRPRPERGPIIVCLDTSGSMAGLPEQIAKAITLEAVRRAAQEKRLCQLYAFSGPGDVRAHTLSLDPRGLVALLDFLTSSFHGGTDVDAPLAAAIARLDHEKWSRADVLLVSDGQFAASTALTRRVTHARDSLQARFHGLLIGHDSPAMQRLCDPVHRFTDWQAVIGSPPTATPNPLLRQPRRR